MVGPSLSPSDEVRAVDQQPFGEIVDWVNLTFQRSVSDFRVHQCQCQELSAENNGLRHRGVEMSVRNHRALHPSKKLQCCGRVSCPYGINLITVKIGVVCTPDFGKQGKVSSISHTLDAVFGSVQVYHIAHALGLQGFRY